MLGGSTALLFLGLPVAFSFLVINLAGALLFLGGRAKGPFLAAFGADIFFDDSAHNIDSARQHVAAGHVPHGVANPD